MTGKKPSLGRGLAELSPLMARKAAAIEQDAPPPVGDRMANLPLDLLQRGKYQPRSDMRPETLNALVAADSVMVPMQCEYYALEGLSALVQTIDQIKGSINPDLEIEGLLRTMFDPRNNLANEVSAQLIEHFGEKVFRTMIPRNIRLAEAPSFGKPALFHDKESRGALAYLALAGEMIRRDELPPAPVESAVSSPGIQE